MGQPGRRGRAGRRRPSRRPRCGAARPPAGLAVGAAVVSVVVAVGVATGLYPWETRPSPSTRRACGTPSRTAPQGWLDTTTPIDTGRFPGAIADVELAFTFAAGRARVAADRRAAGRCWPSASASPPSPSPARWSTLDGGVRARAAVPGAGRADAGRLRPAVAAAAGARPCCRSSRVGGCAIAAALILSRRAGRAQGRLPVLADLESAGRQRAAGQRRLRLGSGLPPASPGRRRGPRSSRSRSPRPMYWKAAVLDRVHERPLAGAAGGAAGVQRRHQVGGRARSSSCRQFADPDSKDLEAGVVPGQGAGRPAPARRPASRWPTRSDDASRAQLTTDGTVTLAADPSQGRDLHDAGLRARSGAQGPGRRQHRLPDRRPARDRGRRRASSRLGLGGAAGR